MDWSLLIAALPGLAALIAAVLGYRKGKTDANAVMVKTALSLVEPLEKRIAVLEAQVSVLRQENEELREGVRVLCDQIRALGHEPRWRPRNGSD